MTFKFTWLTSLAFPAAAYVSSFQNKTNVIVRYGAVCMCAVSVDFSLYHMTDCNAGLLTVCSPLRLLSAPTYCREDMRTNGFVSSASPERSHTQRFHGDDFMYVHPSCTSLFILLFIKSQYTVFAHLICCALFIL